MFLSREGSLLISSSSIDSWPGLWVRVRVRTLRTTCAAEGGPLLPVSHVPEQGGLPNS